MSKIMILLVDDHELVIAGIKNLLQRKESLEVVGEAKSGVEAIEKVKLLNPDIVLMDIRMPGFSGIEACREIKDFSNTKVIMLTSYADEEAVMASLLAGAEGYVLKQIGSEDLINAIETVHKGGALLDPVITKTVIQKMKILNTDQKEDALLRKLTEQERNVMALLTEGKTNKEIAKELCLAEKTIRNYVSNILHKFEFQSRAQAIAYGIKHNIYKR